MPLAAPNVEQHTKNGMIQAITPRVLLAKSCQIIREIRIKSVRGEEHNFLQKGSIYWGHNFFFGKKNRWVIKFLMTKMCCPKMTTDCLCKKTAFNKILACLTIRCIGYGERVIEFLLSK